MRSAPTQNPWQESKPISIALAQWNEVHSRNGVTPEEKFAANETLSGAIRAFKGRVLAIRFMRRTGRDSWLMDSNELATIVRENKRAFFDTVHLPEFMMRKANWLGILADNLPDTVTSLIISDYDFQSYNNENFQWKNGSQGNLLPPDNDRTRREAEMISSYINTVLTSHPEITHFGIINSRIGLTPDSKTPSYWLTQLASAITGTSVTSLDLSNNRISEEALETALRILSRQLTRVTLCNMLIFSGLPISKILEAAPEIRDLTIDSSKLSEKIPSNNSLNRLTLTLVYDSRTNEDWFRDGYYSEATKDSRLQKLEEIFDKIHDSNITYLGLFCSNSRYFLTQNLYRNSHDYDGKSFDVIPTIARLVRENGKITSMGISGYPELPQELQDALNENKQRLEAETLKEIMTLTPAQFFNSQEVEILRKSVKEKNADDALVAITQLANRLQNHLPEERKEAITNLAKAIGVISGIIPTVKNKITREAITQDNPAPEAVLRIATIVMGEVRSYVQNTALPSEILLNIAEGVFGNGEISKNLKESLLSRANPVAIAGEAGAEEKKAVEAGPLEDGEWKIDSDDERPSSTASDANESTPLLPGKKELQKGK